MIGVASNVLSCFGIKPRIGGQRVVSTPTIQVETVSRQRRPLVHSFISVGQSNRNIQTPRGVRVDEPRMFRFADDKCQYLQTIPMPRITFVHKKDRED